MRRAVAWRVWLVPLMLWGCIGVNKAAHEQIAEQRLPRPSMIVVHDFAVAPDEVERNRPWASARLVEDSDRTVAEKAVGHAFAGAFSTALIDEIRKLGLPADSTAAPDLPSGDVVTVEGRFISLAGDPSAAGIVGFAGSRPDVIADVQLYGTKPTGEELSEDMEVSLTEGGELIPAALLPDPTITAGQIATGPVMTPELKAKLTTAAEQAATTVARQLEPYFADQGWIARPQS